MMSFRWVYLVSILLTIAVVYQQCSPVSFQNDRNSESQSQPPEDTDNEFQGNGSLYTGTTQYGARDLQNQCDQSDWIFLIAKTNQDYQLLIDNCHTISPITLSPEEIQQATGSQFVFRDHILVDTEVNYEESIQSYPSSCQEIFDNGWAQGNGFYFLAQLETSLARSEFCNIEYISQGWSPWSSWSECSVTCGEGVETRTRTCQISSCNGPNQETRSCQAPPCQ